MTTIQEQVRELVVGDWVEARFEDGQASAVYTDVLLGDKQLPLWLEIREKIIRYKDGEPAEGLVSITRVPRPIPSEPEVMSFALLKARALSDIPRIAERLYGAEEPKSWRHYDEWHSWPEIYPHITRLYTPSGDEVTGFEYYKSEGN